MITNGDTQWMTAGAGILHIEKPPEHLVMSGGLFHGIQLWVNLPKAQKWRPALPGPPRRRDIAARLEDGGALVRVIAGELDDHRGPGQTFTPITLVHASVSPGARLTFPGAPTSTRWPMSWPARERSAPNAGPFETGQLAVFGAGDTITLDAAPPGARPPSSKCCSSAAARSVSPSPLRPVRHEHEGRAGAGFRGLSSRPARLVPAVHAHEGVDVSSDDRGNDPTA